MTLAESSIYQPTFNIDSDVRTFEESCRRFLDDVLRPQARLQVLHETLHEGHEVLALPDTAGHGLLQHVVCGVFPVKLQENRSQICNRFSAGEFPDKTLAWQNWVGQDDLVLPPLLRLPQSGHQPVVLAPQSIRVSALERLDLSLQDLRAGKT